MAFIINTVNDDKQTLSLVRFDKVIQLMLDGALHIIIIHSMINIDFR